MNLCAPENISKVMFMGHSLICLLNKLFDTDAMAARINFLCPLDENSRLFQWVTAGCEMGWINLFFLKLIIEIKNEIRSSQFFRETFFRIVVLVYQNRIAQFERIELLNWNIVQC